MIMILHEDEGVELEVKTRRQFGEQFQEMRAVAVIVVNGPALDPPRRDMIPGARMQNA